MKRNLIFLFCTGMILAFAGCESEMPVESGGLAGGPVVRDVAPRNFARVVYDGSDPVMHKRRYRAIMDHIFEEKYLYAKDYYLIDIPVAEFMDDWEVLYPISDETRRESIRFIKNRVCGFVWRNIDLEYGREEYYQRMIPRMNYGPFFEYEYGLVVSLNRMILNSNDYNELYLELREYKNNLRRRRDDYLCLTVDMITYIIKYWVEPGRFEEWLEATGTNTENDIWQNFVYYQMWGYLLGTQAVFEVEHLGMDYLNPQVNLWGGMAGVAIAGAMAVVHDLYEVDFSDYERDNGQD